MLKFVKRGDLFGLQSIFKKVRLLNLEKVCDDFGEVEFGESECEALLKLFNTSDVSVLRRINPM